MRFDASTGGVRQETRLGGGWILGPPNYQFSETTPHHSPQTTAHRPQEHLVTPCAQSAVADCSKVTEYYIHTNKFYSYIRILLDILQS